MTETKKINLKEIKELLEKKETQLKYLQADFENFKKISDKEKNKFIDLANYNLIRELITILDNFDSAIYNTTNNEYKEGLILLKHNFYKILESHGLEKINTENQKFDVHLHESVAKIASDKEEGIILEEIQTGYKFKNNVIRHSKVKISEYIKEEKEK